MTATGLAFASARSAFMVTMVNVVVIATAINATGTLIIVDVGRWVSTAPARASSAPFQQVLQQYAMERFLYRISKSKHAQSVRAIEELWESVSREEARLESPSWHQDALFGHHYVTKQTRRRHSPPQICRMEGVICYEVARDV
jgi:hypothetical protein